MCKPVMGNTTYPLLGNGNRPPESYHKTYGMPSGHAQAAGFFLANSILTNKPHWIPSMILCFEVSFSRIIEKHHTPQHVIVGFIIGFLFRFCL